jgi:hypothetical protein
MHAKLTEIQTKIKAPKNLYNSFGKYKYRNAEGICEAVKPYLAEQKCSLTLSDEIIDVGGRIYVKATATLHDNETSESISVSAMAREAEEKKGMDESQITGTASSYARKYALNGLFLLDDTKDADSDEHHVEAEEKQKRANEEEAHNKAVEDVGKMKISQIKVDALTEKAVADNVPLKRILELYKLVDVKLMTEKQYRNCIDNWEKIKGME